MVILSLSVRLQSKQSFSQKTSSQHIRTFVATTEETLESTSPKFSMRDIQALL